MNTLEAGYREVPAGWLLQDGPALFRHVRAFGRAAGTDETAVATSLLCQAWAVAVTREAIASLVGARRVSELASSNNVLLFDGDGRPTRATLASPCYAAVAGDDEAADDPRAEIVADDDALFTWTQRRLFDGHL